MDTGGGFLGNVGSGLSGYSDRKRREGILRWLRGLYDQPAISQEQIQRFIPTMQASMTPSLNRLGRTVSTRLGLDSGAAQGEIARQSYGGLAQMLGGVQQKAMFTNAQRQQEIMKLMAMIGAG